jgi:hypothetical protein
VFPEWTIGKRQGFAMALVDWLKRRASVVQSIVDDKTKSDICQA